MTEQELKSAFDIDGFLEGKTEVCHIVAGTTYSLIDGVLHVKNIHGVWVESNQPFNYMNESRWTPVPPAKPKMYVHKWWDHTGYLNTRKSDMKWSDYAETCQGRVELISTEEVRGE